MAVCKPLPELSPPEFPLPEIPLPELPIALGGCGRELDGVVMRDVGNRSRKKKRIKLHRVYINFSDYVTKSLIS